MIIEDPINAGMFEVVGEPLVHSPATSYVFLMVGVVIEDPFDAHLFDVIDVPVYEDPLGTDLYVPPFTDYYEDPLETSLYTVGVIPAPVAEPVATWSLDLCHGWMRIGEVIDPDFTAVIRHLDIGHWTLTVPPEAVRFGSYPDPDDPDTALYWGVLDVDTVRLVYNNTIEFAGYVQGESEDDDAGFQRVIDASGEQWTWSGIDLWGGVLTSRVAYPVPSTELGWVASHDTNTGIASTVLTNYLNDNLATPALFTREYAGLVVADELEGMSDTWTARLQRLDELVKRICNDAGLVCRLSIDFDGNITATIGSPRDLSAQHVISDQGDLSMLKVHWRNPTATYVIAGGAGEGTGRVFRASNSGATGAARRELFVDQSSLESVNELAATATATRALNGASYSVHAELTDTAADELQYLRDYQIGDSLAVQVNASRFVVPVTSVAFEINATRQVVRPTLGTATPDALKRLLRRLDLATSRNANSIS